MVTVASSFNDRCYKVLAKVPKGKVTTYKEIAQALRSKGFRAVGNAMNKNPNAPRIPCHRVVRTDGSIGGYAKGPKRKIDMLKKEGILIENGKVVNLDKVLFNAASLNR